MALLANNYLCGVAVDTRGEGGAAMTLAQEEVDPREADSHVQLTMELDKIRSSEGSARSYCAESAIWSGIAERISSGAAASAEMAPNDGLAAGSGGTAHAEKASATSSTAPPPNEQSGSGLFQGPAARAEEGSLPAAAGSGSTAHAEKASATSSTVLAPAHKESGSFHGSLGN